jgi:hypothetical protein
MKKINWMLALLLLVSTKMLAQSTPVEGKVEYDKVMVPCYNIELPVSEEVATEAIKNRFKKMGANGKERKGFLEFKNVNIPELKTGLVDAYIKIEQKTKKEKKSAMSFIITEPGVAPSSSSTEASSSIASAGVLGLLSSLSENSAYYGLNLEIKAQEDKVKKAEKEYKNAVNEGEALQNELKKVQYDIEANRNRQQNQAQEVNKQKELLLQIQALQKNAPGEKINKVE